MATVGNERYLRHLWLLGEGGLLVLREIVTREIASSGQPLEHILASKRSAFNNILREQNLLLFPTSSTVNHDVSTWDSSLLLLVIKRIFWSRLSPADQSSIGILKTYRNCIQGHPTSLSMEINDYDTNRVVLEAALRQLASGLGANSTSEIEDIIQNSRSGNIDIGSVLRRTKDLLEFETTLKSLENKIEHINSSLRDMAVSSERDFRETKDEQRRMLEIVLNMEKMNRTYIHEQTMRQISKRRTTFGLFEETDDDDDFYSSKSIWSHSLRPTKRSVTKVESEDNLPYRTPDERLRRGSGRYVSDEVGWENRSTTEETDDKTHTFSPEERISDDFLSRFKKLNKRSTKTESEDKTPKYTTDEATLVPLFHPFTKLEKKATKAEIQDKTHTYPHDEAKVNPIFDPFTEHEKTATHAEIEDKTHTYIHGHKESHRNSCPW